MEKRKLKIAQVVSLSQDVPPKSQNGLEFVVSYLTEELVKRGHKVTLFSSAESISSAEVRSVLPKNLYKTESKYNWNTETKSSWNTAYAASCSKEFDIIHTHTGTIAYSMPFIDTPIIETLHHPAHYEFFNDAFKNKKKIISIKGGQGKIYNKSKFITDQYEKINFVCVSKNQEKSFLKFNKYFFKKHTNIHNGIPVENFKIKTDFSNKISKIKINDKKIKESVLSIINSSPYLFYIGYINKEKGAHIAVEMAKKTGIPLIMAGNNYGMDEFFDSQIKPHLNDKIIYVGPVDFNTKNVLYSHALVTLAPIMWDEPFGLTLAESGACGTPVIAFNRGASKEIIKNGITGFVVENKDEMLQAIKKIAESHKNSSNLIESDACRDHIEKNFSIKKMVDTYEEYYYSILGK